VSFESDDLVDALVSSTARTEGSLPLLQFALAELWEARDQHRKTIPNSALEKIGGVAGALARHADSVVASLPAAARQAARRILVSLVTSAVTRTRRSETELTDGDPHARAALDALVRGRILTARDATEAWVYELTHEALVEGWTTLRRWTEEEA